MIASRGVLQKEAAYARASSGSIEYRESDISSRIAIGDEIDTDELSPRPTAIETSFGLARARARAYQRGFLLYAPSLAVIITKIMDGN